MPPSVRQWVIAFLLGMGTAVVVSALAVSLGFLPWHHPSATARRWDLWEVGPGHLAVTVSEPVPIRAEVEIDPQDAGLRRIQISRRDGVAAFCYSVQGASGARAEYAAGPARARVAWIDLNGDGWFDMREMHEDARAHIRMDHRWMEADVVNGVARTAEGQFKFDTESGEWLPVVSERSPGLGPRPGAQ